MGANHRRHKNECSMKKKTIIIMIQIISNNDNNMQVTIVVSIIGVGGVYVGKNVEHTYIHTRVSVSSHLERKNDNKQTSLFKEDGAKFVSKQMVIDNLM